MTDVLATRSGEETREEAFGPVLPSRPSPSPRSTIRGFSKVHTATFVGLRPLLHSKLSGCGYFGITAGGAAALTRHHAKASVCRCRLGRHRPGLHRGRDRRPLLQEPGGPRARSGEKNLCLPCDRGAGLEVSDQEIGWPERLTRAVRVRREPRSWLIATALGSQTIPPSRHCTWLPLAAASAEAPRSWRMCLRRPPLQWTPQ